MNMQNLKIRRVILCILALALSVAAAYCILTFLPHEKYSGFYPPCPLHKLTGFYCSGCGSTRMLSCLAHFDLYGAFRQNPLALIALPFVIYGIAVYLGDYCGVKIPSYKLSGKAIYCILALILLYTILRNLPFPPFSALAPS